MGSRRSSKGGSELKELGGSSCDALPGASQASRGRRMRLQAGLARVSPHLPCHSSRPCRLEGLAHERRSRRSTAVFYPPRPKEGASAVYLTDGLCSALASTIGTHLRATDWLLRSSMMRGTIALSTSAECRQDGCRRAALHIGQMTFEILGVAPPVPNPAIAAPGRRPFIA